MEKNVLPTGFSFCCCLEAGSLIQGHMVLFVCLMLFNAIFNNISVISWQSALLVEETRGT